MQIVVLAGGLATRMWPDTEHVPKSLLLVRGRPFIDWQLDRFAAAGAKSIVLCVGHLGEQIEAHVRRGTDRGLMVSYSYDGGQRLGTGGALRRALARLEPEFVVTYGDSYLPFDYASPLRDLAAHPAASASMSVYQNRGELEPSNVALEDGLIVQYQKGAQGPGFDHIDHGATALRRASLESIADGAVWDLGALWSKLARQKQLRACVSLQRFYEIGSARGLGELEAHLAAESAL